MPTVRELRHVCINAGLVVPAKTRKPELERIVRMLEFAPIPLITQLIQQAQSQQIRREPIFDDIMAETTGVTWGAILKQMEDGTFRLPVSTNSHGRFRWLTSPLWFDHTSGQIIGRFRQELIRDMGLDSAKSNPAYFADHLTRVKNTAVATTFPNLDNSCVLVVPMPHKNKDYATLYDFVQTASHSVQTGFWHEVGGAIRSLVLRHPGDKIWVSTHGYGVPYLHVRVCRQPKYYPHGHPFTE